MEPKAANDAHRLLTANPAENVPRYTSYPTAPHFHSGVDAVTVRGWLNALESSDEISLYLHIPYCDRLCWFCACHTKQTRHYAPVATFLRSLHREIETVGGLVSGLGRVRAVHFGGGSPTMLKPDDILMLGSALRDRFDFLDDASLSVEIDPSDMDEGRLDAFAAIGMTRASLGVQDFDPKVQKAINREQSFALTKSIVDAVRARGVTSVNLDLLYGLPHQTCESVAATVSQALTLAPDRLALFGYAHVPWFKKHQTMIDEAWLPDSAARLAQSQLAARLIVNAGYEALGLDHFAKPQDTLAVAARGGKIRRNFQGYTEDQCETLIGLGPSAISRFRQGYAQNIIATGEYEKVVNAGQLAVARGIEFSVDDQARAWVIERLMCNFTFSAIELVERFGNVGQRLLCEASRLAIGGAGQLLRLDGENFIVPEQSRPLVRTVAAKFDKYLRSGTARHSVAV
ncbi:oxygen-independent coproporphyrinogen III oxidase [Mesorhizobium sp. M1C.F.Ca.ET.193.01.1.1]|uniref:oxygen-independent coproporphyrinogen III oxidase n=3 Tax=Mesorhizobium TaxID=68287 RepID=UPI000FD4FB29|nr:MULTISPECIES: oxygen-independent coproporphyrinogen III oxidase [unclassified Mesorhizobium]TGS99045.1 oxygen-independent coproporphyrinogen III oxidase [bacterium M00.F.Ca.ET.177.01.1.1]TGQ53083.1 oxygen-independent coproporphyrinogen III oxidase [Mesorhizobium sp. M1C.F.Ca.ET.210.01.1.1]TGQ70360.1 oxygen-independent coproporphyrinogen III oxidase [Mesorhizobium sp. M1C.F.Ca.ET.212.01.1.1]TGR06691.1 oxygen-independent coproporphyrinogen III oxidase [Mesorhizobium sp. M1C.F.Ca.ET.204.01.1.1]